MGRFIAEVVIPMAVALIYYGVSYHMLKRKIASINDPVLALPRRERRAWARTLLARQNDEYIQNIVDKTLQPRREI